MAELRVGVLGATSIVGQSLVPLLQGTGRKVVAYSRLQHQQKESIEFRSYPSSVETDEVIPEWICLAPIWTLPEHFALLKACRAKRIVALSSTSVFSKQESTDQTEQRTAGQLVEGERELISWAEKNGIEWVILRPTLIYGKNRDRNISEIANFISRFGFFPLLGNAEGLRQPVHVDDVAAACLSALQHPRVCNRAYEISGAEILTYREMVARVFKAMGKPERFIHIPLILFSAAIRCLRVLPRYRKWSTAMAVRMNSDLVFAHIDATHDLDFHPRTFKLSKADLISGKDAHSA